MQMLGRSVASLNAAQPTKILPSPNLVQLRALPFFTNPVKFQNLRKNSEFLRHGKCIIDFNIVLNITSPRIAIDRSIKVGIPEGITDTECAAEFRAWQIFAYVPECGS
jgi:hypothetical protein